MVNHVRRGNLYLIVFSSYVRGNIGAANSCSRTSNLTRVCSTPEGIELEIHMYNVFIYNLFFTIKIIEDVFVKKLVRHQC